MISKKNFTIVTIVSILLLSACSFDQRYRYEANGNADYLNSPALKPIAVPTGFSFPKQDSRYSIYMPAAKGETGMDVDIFPPSLPLATLDGSFAYYRQGAVYLDAPEKISLWESIIALLKHKSISIRSHNDNEIITGKVVDTVSAREIPYKATYRITHQKKSGRQILAVELISLFAGKNDIFANPIYKQRYTVNFFNGILLELKKNHGV